MAESMVERVAMVIDAAEDEWALHPGGKPPLLEFVARAVIEAMMPPTEAMMIAGCKEDDILGELVDWKGDACTTRETVARVFNAMIDAALSEIGATAPTEREPA